ALPLRSATNVRVTGARPLSVRALPKAMVGTAIAAAIPTAVKANSFLFSMGSLSLDTKNSLSGCSAHLYPAGNFPNQRADSRGLDADALCQQLAVICRVAEQQLRRLR